MLTRAETEANYAHILAQTPLEAQQTVRATLGREDLYYLLTQICGREDLRHDWLYERIREVQRAPDGRLDLWARRHAKTSSITFGLTLQDILNNPEIKVMILSFNKTTATSMLRPIKRAMETSDTLRWLYPEVCWENPERQAPTWRDDAIVVRRKGNAKEATVEAYGLVDGQPVGRHPDLVVYDDVVTRDAVSSPDMIQKTTQAWQESLALGAGVAKRRVIGTRWHFADTYQDMLDSGTVVPRIHPARTPDGTPVYMTQQQLAELYQGMGPMVFACQMLLDPRQESAIGFDEQWLRYYRTTPSGRGMSIYILVDPANSRKRDSSYTAMCVVGLGSDSHYYWLDGIRDRLGPSERFETLFGLHQTWQRRAGARARITVGYECYGTQAGDVEQLKEEQDRRAYRFPIIELRGRENKDDRIPRLEPDYRAGRWYWPETLIKRRLAEGGQTYDLVDEMRREEYNAYPFGRHPDFLDAMSRIKDPALEVVWPKPTERPATDLYDDEDASSTSWMAA